MSLSKSDLEAIEHVIRLTITRSFGETDEVWRATSARLADLEGKFVAGLENLTSNIESLRDVLSQ
jgi:hypothetical protein